MRVRASKRLYREKDSSRQWGRRGEPQPRAAGLAEHDCQHGSARRSRILRAASPSRVLRAAPQATQSQERPKERPTICTGGSSARARFGAEDFMNPPAAHEDALNGPRRLADDSNYASRGTSNPLHDSNHGRKRRPRLRTRTRTRRATHDGHPALKGREGRSVSANPPPARTAGSKDGNANAPLGARSRARASTLDPAHRPTDPRRKLLRAQQGVQRPSAER